MQARSLSENRSRSEKVENRRQFFASLRRIAVLFNENLQKNGPILLFRCLRLYPLAGCLSASRFCILGQAPRQPPIINIFKYVLITAYLLIDLLNNLLVAIVDYQRQKHCPRETVQFCRTACIRAACHSGTFKARPPCPITVLIQQQLRLWMLRRYPSQPIHSPGYVRVESVPSFRPIRVLHP